MKIGDHLADARDSARQGANQVMLIAIIDAQIGVGRPDQNCIDSAIALQRVVNIAIYGVAVSRRIVEKTIFDHHLRLNETGLRPL